MTRERENELMAEMQRLRCESQQVIQRIVDARLRGERDEKAIKALSEISRKEVELTKPDFAELYAA